MSDFLPPHLLSHILLLLPIKSLLICTSVSKSWYHLITSSSFIPAHLSLSNNNLFLLRYDPHSASKERYNLHYDNQGLDLYRHLKCTFPAQNKYYLRFVASVNGLICLSDDVLGYTNIVIIWNPSIQKYVSLPRSRVTFQEVGPYMFVLGFGCDLKTNDYKVVRVVYLEGKNGQDKLPPKVEVYALREKRWRAVDADAVDYHMVEQSWSHCFMDGATHWISYRRNTVDGMDFHNLILLFDLGEEVFKKMKLPEELVGQSPWSLSISTFGGLFSVTHFHRPEKICNLWVQNEYGVTESWSKMCTIDLAGKLRRPLELRNSGDILMAAEKGKLVSYDPNSRGAKNLEISGTNYVYWACTYRESLFLLDKESGAVSKPVRKRCDKSKLGVKNDASVSKDEGRSIVSDDDELDSSEEEDTDEIKKFSKIAFQMLQFHH